MTAKKIPADVSATIQTSLDYSAKNIRDYIYPASISNAHEIRQQGLDGIAKAKVWVKQNTVKSGALRAAPNQGAS